jgi:hypothetical protein
MSQIDAPQPDPDQEISLLASEEQNKQIMKAFENLVERISPWLLEFGSWIFGGLIAFTLLVIASLFTIGPVDRAVTISTAAFAFALPLNLTGLLLLRLVNDLKHVGFEEELEQAFEGTDPVVREKAASQNTLESMRKRRTIFFLSISFGILELSVLLILIGMIAVLWHMAWWIGVAFFVIVILCLVLVYIAISKSQPPESPDEKKQKRHYREELTRQAKERRRQSREELARQAKEQKQKKAE